MDEIIIRPARLNDIPALLEFEQGLIAAEKPFDITLKDKPKYYDINALITEPHIEMAVAELNNKLIASGYARIENAKVYLKHPQHAYMGFMYVMPDYRGNGINQKIMTYLKDWAVAKGITEMRLDVYYGNEPAIKAYKKMGFIKHMIEMRTGI